MHEDDDSNHVVLTSPEKDFLSATMRETANDSFHRELRVQFASAALSGIMADHTITMDAKGVARVCWLVADAMLAAMDEQDAGE